jgi:hypothetical protein
VTPRIFGIDDGPVADLWTMLTRMAILGGNAQCTRAGRLLDRPLGVANEDLVARGLKEYSG